MRQNIFKKISAKTYIWAILGVLFFGLLNTAFISNKGINPLIPFDTSVPVSAQSETKPYISISKGGRYNYQSGGLINFTSTEQPLIQLRSYRAYGNAKVQIYEASQDDLFNFLTHDDKNNPTKKPSLDEMNQINQLEYSLDEKQSTKDLPLPLPENGIYLIKAALGDVSTQIMVTRSSFGVVMSQSAEQYIFWAQDYLTGKKLSGGELNTYSFLNGINKINSSSFDKDGIAKTNFQTETEVAIAQINGNISVVPINSSYWSNYNSNWLNKRSTYFVFTDRPVYKPGDKLHFKAILRYDQDVEFSIPKGVVKVSLNGGENNVKILDNKEFVISESGAIDGEIDIPVDVPTGYFNLDISKVSPTNDSESNYGGGASFQIQYYTKPEYGIDLSLDKDEVIMGQAVQATIKADYFSGTPVANQKVSYQVLANDFYQYENLSNGYNLNDYRFWGYGNIVDRGEVALDENGQAVVTLNTSKYDIVDDGLTRGVDKILSVRVQLKDQSQNPVMASKNLVSFAGDYNIYRRNYDSYNGQTNQKYDLPLVLTAHKITENKESVGGRDLYAKIKRTWWEKVENPNNRYPDWNQKEENLPDISFKSNDKGEATMSFTPLNAGSYEFLVESNDASNRLVINTFRAWVSDVKQPVWASAGENAITVKADKPSYAPGDKAKIRIESQKSDVDVFVAVERANLIRYQVISLKDKNADFDLDLVDKDLPNVFVTAFSFFDNRINQSESELKVSAQSRKLNVVLTPNQTKYGAGDTVTLNIETKDNAGKAVQAETTVWVVDKAIYELSDDKPQNIFEKFYNERYNNARHSDSLSGVFFPRSQTSTGCFTADTTVLMSDGSSKEISKIQAGDMVLTRSDESDSKLVSARVNQLMEHTVDGYLILNGSLKVTPEHRLYVRQANTSKSKWVNAGFVQIGDILVDKNGSDQKVKSIEWQAGITKVYNLEIDTYHTYFAGDVFVHNDKGGGARSIFSDTAYWNPSVQTDKNGKATVTFKLPDNLTTWVLAGISATNDSKFGQTETEIIVSKPIIVRPVVPNILRIGDENTISAIVQNSSGQEQSLSTEFLFPDGEITQNNDKTFTLKNGETKQIFWKVKPNKANDNSKITFAAYKTDDVNTGDRIEYKVPVIAYGFESKTAQTGDRARDYDLNLYSDTDLGRSKITLQLSPTLLGALPSSMDYLVGYPYGCVEQTTSRFVPSVIAYENPDIFKNAFKDYNKDDLLSDGVSHLMELQNNDGGWGFWTSGESSPYVSVYVLEFLNRAFVLKPDLKEKFNSEIRYNPSSYFENIVASETNKDKLNKEYALSIYALSMIKKADLSQETQNKIKSFVSDYKKYFKDQTSDILAMIVMANYRNGYTNPKENGLDILMSKAKIEGETLFWSGGEEKDFGSNNASTALALKAMIETKVDKDFQAKAVRFLVNERKSNYWSNTYATARTIDVLTTYSKLNSELKPNYTYSVSLDGVQIDAGQITKSTDIKDISIDLSKIKSTGSKLSITQTGKGVIYSTLLNNQFRTDPKFGGLSEGLNVTRRFVNTKDGSSNFAVGDVVNVKITVSGLNATHNYGIIADELPAGLVPINTALDNEKFNQPDSNSFYANDQEVTRNGVNMHVYEMWPVSSTYAYQARVVSEGTFIVPPARAELMYYPEINGLSSAETLTIGATTLKEASQVLPVNQTSVLNFQFDPQILEDIPTTQKLLYLILGMLLVGILFLVGVGAYVLKKKNHRKKLSGDGVKIADQNEVEKIENP